MRWLIPIVVAACGRPPTPTCPVCAPSAPAPSPAPVATEGNTEDPTRRLEFACGVAETVVSNGFLQLQVLAHDLMEFGSIYAVLDKPRAQLQDAMEKTMSSLYKKGPFWLVFDQKTAILAASQNAPAIDKLAPVVVVDDPVHHAALIAIDGEETVVISAPIRGPKSYAWLVLAQPVAFRSGLGSALNVKVTIEDSVEGAAPNPGCQIVGGKAAFRIDKRYVVLAPN